MSQPMQDPKEQLRDAIVNKLKIIAARNEKYMQIEEELFKMEQKIKQNLDQFYKEVNRNKNM